MKNNKKDKRIKKSKDLVESKTSKKKNEGKRSVAVSKPIEKVHFQSWFAKQVIFGKLKAWQEQEIKIFFKEKNLTEIEDPKEYDKILKLY